MFAPRRPILRFYPFIHKFRFAVLLVFSAVMAFYIYLGSQLEPESEVKPLEPTGLHVGRAFRSGPARVNDSRPLCRVLAMFVRVGFVSPSS